MVLGLSVLGIASGDKAYAKTAEMYLEVPESIKKENEFTVTVVLESDVQLYSIDAYLSYNAELLEFIPDSNYVTGAEGVLELKDVYSEETKNATYEIHFKALDTGMAEIALTDVYLIDYEDLDYITVTPSAKQFEIGINRTVAEDARLSELIVAPGTFTEEFNPNKLEYEMRVGLEVTTVGVSAIPMNEDSVVGLEMPDSLELGENIIKVTVTALSGNVNEYRITVIREEIMESSEESSVDDTFSTEEDIMEGTTEETTTEDTSVKEDATVDTPMEESTTEDTSMKEDTAGGTPMEEESTTAEVSVKEDTTEETPVEKATKEVPMERNTSEKTADVQKND